MTNKNFCYVKHVIRPMEIKFLAGSRQHPHGFFLPCQNISSFVTDCFLPTTKYPKVTRLAFDSVQVLEWVLLSNCNCYLVFFLHFWTILTIQRYAHSLKLWNEAPSNKFETSLPQK